MSKRIIGGLLAALLATGILAACGGGDEETVEALTKAEFIERGDAICVEGDKEIEIEGEAFAEENEIDVEDPTAEQAEELVTEVFVPALREQADGIGELGAPEGDEERVEAIVAALEAAIGELEDDPSLIFGAESPLQEASELAAAYGFEDCGG